MAWPDHPSRRPARFWRGRLGLAAVVLLCWSSPLQAEEDSEADLVSALQAVAASLEDPGDLDPLLDRIGDARYVLLGEASHGTSEYYTWRAHVSRRLIEEKDFAFVAVEGDWPDLHRVNDYVMGAPGAGNSAYEVLNAFERWPTWMWANWEVVAFVEWLRDHNEALPEGERVGFYGLDVYSLWTSLVAVVDFLDEDPTRRDVAERARACFEAYDGDEMAYARATLAGASCRDEASALRAAVRTSPAARDPEAHFDAEQNAHVVVNAEAYYRAMPAGGPASWNVRDHHMADTLDRLVAQHGPGAKAIVWEHNTHIGDARATTMADEGMTNVGQLARERHGSEGVVLVGFGSYQGSVVAARSWGAEIELMTVPEARAGSWEALLHEAEASDKLLILSGLQGVEAAMRPRGHRAIGVVYDPELEGFNYVPTVLPRRYDAFIFLDETAALHPLHVQPRETDPPELTTARRVG